MKQRRNNNDIQLNLHLRIDEDGKFDEEYYLKSLDYAIKNWHEAGEDENLYKDAEDWMCELTVENIARKVFKIESKELVKRCQLVIAEKKIKDRILNNIDKYDFELVEAAKKQENTDWIEIIEDIFEGKYEVSVFIQKMVRKLRFLWRI